MSELPENEFHCCKQEDQIAKMNLLLLGNGNPKDGYVYKVMEMTDRVNEINDKLTGISGIVKELHEESIGKKAVTNHKKINFVQIVKVLGIVIAAIAIVVNAYLDHKKDKDVQTAVRQEIRNMEGVSSVTRGGNVKYNNHGLADSINIHDILIMKQLRGYIDEINKAKK